MAYFSASKLEETVSTCYEASVQLQLWSAALDALAQAAGAEGTTLLDRRRDFACACSGSFDKHMDVFIRENWSSRNYRPCSK
jgi:hypothetical protein